MTKKIVLDPGHGGFDPGAEGFGLQEKNINLDIATNLRTKLANYADISMTRSSDVFVSLADRAALANKLGADLFVSIHINSGGGTGFESYVYSNANQAYEKIRLVVHQEVAAFYKSNGFPDRGMKRANFAVLRETHMPAMLLENLFIDKKEDAAKLADSAFRQEIAGAIAIGIIRSLGLVSLPTKSPIPTPTPSPNPTPSPTPTPTPTPSPSPSPTPTPTPTPSPSPTSPTWAVDAFKRITDAGLVKNQHDLQSNVTWGEMSAVIANLLDKMKI